MKRLLKEPLLHFLLLGAALFLAHRLLPGAADPRGTAEIRITQGQVEHLAAGFTKTWQRPPTPDELAGLVRDRVREEVYCREALALGLDQDDTVIRRRLRQKMEFVSEDLAAQAEPGEADLLAHLQAHPDAFRTPPRFTFSQVYLDPGKHEGRLAAEAARLLAQLNRGEVLDGLPTLGDALMLDHQFTQVAATEVAAQFGGSFAAKLGELAPGQWQGPIESGYGVHLVLVRERLPGRVPPLAEVRDAVARDWAGARRREANERFYAELLQRYTVTIEADHPTPIPGGKPLAQVK